MLRLSRLAGARFTWTRTRSRWERARRQPGRRGRSPSTQCSTRPSLNTARRIWGSSIGCFYAIAPTSHPMHAVIAIARPPQNATRIAPLITLASPARAASPPISARTVCDDRETNGINCAFGAITSDHEWHQRTESKAACSGKGCLQWARAKLLGDQPQARSCGRDRWSPGRPALLLAEIEDEDCWRQLAVASVLVNGPIREHA